MSESIARFVDLFGPQALADLVLGWFPSLLAAVLVLLAFWGLWQALRRLLVAVFHRVNLDSTASTFILAVTKFAIGVVALLTGLSQVGINTTSILATLGVVGLTLGFAAQDTLANVVSGLFIFWDRPFVIGDLVDMDGEYGKVQTITLRSTRLITTDGRLLAIPNKVVAGAKVASYTNFPHLRLDIDVTVGVNEDLGRVRSLLTDLVKGDPAFLADPPPAVVVTALNDYNVALQFRVWIDDEHQHIPQRLRLREAAFETLRATGVDMPYETLALTPLQVRRVDA